jgi:hypothetical protein
VWPNLRPYNSHKLEFRSKQCVFIGYSNSHKGFKCLDPKEGHVYISQDVVFDESIFPFASLHKNAGARLRAELHLLPEIIRNPSMQFGDAIVHDQQMGSPGNTNGSSSTVDVHVTSETNSSSTDSSHASNGGPRDRHFMCQIPGGSTDPGGDSPTRWQAPSTSGSAPSSSGTGADSGTDSGGSSALASSLQHSAPRASAPHPDPIEGERQQQPTTSMSGSQLKADPIGSAMANLGSGAPAGSASDPAAPVPTTATRPATRSQHGIN